MARLALLGGTPVRTASFPPQQTFGVEEREAVMKVLDSGVLSQFLGEPGPDFLGGPQVRAAEREFAVRFGVRHAVATNSATTGLHAAVAAAGIGPGDEVIVPPLTMSATSVAVLMQNAIPVFADVEADTFGLDPSSVRRAVTPRTRAVLAVHLFGHPAEMDGLRSLCDEMGLRLIEDAAQSIGATWRDHATGTLGDAGVLSLNYHKIIHTGEGGILLTDDDDIAQRSRLVRNHGECIVESLGWTDVANTMGSNFRMGEIEAALARQQLRRLDGLLAWRRRLAERLTSRLVGLGEMVTPPMVRPQATHSYYVYAVRLNLAATGVTRRAVAAALAAEGVPFGEGYVRPLYLQPLYQRKQAYGSAGCPWTCSPYQGHVSYEPGLCPMAERLHEQDLLLGDVCHHPLTERDVDDVADAFEKVVSNITDLEAWEHEQDRADDDTGDSPGRRRG